MSLAAASVDGLHAAIARDTELSLYTTEPFVEIARANLEPVTGARTIAFVGRHVLVHDPTRITLHAVPRLQITAQLALDRPVRLLAISHHHAMFARDGELLIASCTSERIAMAPTRRPATAAFAVGLDTAKFITWPSKGPAEIWDAATRLPTARVNLELPPDACAVGTTGKHRSVWIATTGGDLITSRLSDGKTTVAALPRPPHADIAWHPMSAWLVMDFDGIPHALNTVLQTSYELAIPRDRPRTLAPSMGAHAFILLDEVERVSRYEVGADLEALNVVSVPVGGPLPDLEEGAAPIAPAVSPIARVARMQVEVEPREGLPLRASRASDGSDGPRVGDAARMFAARGGDTPRDDAPGVGDAARAFAARGGAPDGDASRVFPARGGSEVGDASRVFPTRGGAADLGDASRGFPAHDAARAAGGAARSGPPTDDGSTSPAAPPDREPGRMRPIAPLVRMPTAPGTPSVSAWREALFQWSKRLAESPTQALPSLESPLTSLADRAELDVAARRILHVLYADWLAGHGDLGIAVARLVDIAGPSAWEEALGNGHLGRCRMVTSQAGRCLLAHPVGAFLDGRPPAHVKRIDGPPTRDVPHGAYRVQVRGPDETLEECAMRLATRLGTIAVAGTDVEAARVEAWLRGWPLVRAGGSPPAALFPHELVIFTNPEVHVEDLPDTTGA